MHKNPTKRSWTCLVTLLVMSWACAGAAHGQGFMVKPMQMEFSPRPGETVESVLHIRNTGMEGPASLDIQIVDLRQDKSGAWGYVAPASEFDTSGLSSCLAWLDVGMREVRIAPGQPVELPVRIETPPGARGTYFAALIVRTQPPPQAPGGIRTVIQFLVPIFVRVQGGAERQRVEFDDIHMTFHSPTGTGGTTKTGFSVSNNGRTFPRIGGTMRVLRQSQERWHPVATVPFRDVGIIPGITLNPEADLERRLPSGLYKLSFVPEVDGRRSPLIEKEIDFVGDPSVTMLAVDSALILEPSTISFEGLAGATRAAVIAVENGGEDPVTVETSAVLPPALKGSVREDLHGHELSCAEWLQVAPSRFTLQPGRRQNLRVTVRLPREELPHALYYGIVSMRAAYLDGQSGGQTDALVSVWNQGISPTQAGEVARLTLAADSDGQYLVQAQTINAGDMHFSPQVRALVLTGRGDIAMQTRMSGDEGMMLPMQSRSFSGLLDFVSVEPGSYLLQVELQYGVDLRTQGELLIQVAGEGRRKIVTVR